MHHAHPLRHVPHLHPRSRPPFFRFSLTCPPGAHRPSPPSKTVASACAPLGWLGLVEFGPVFTHATRAPSCYRPPPASCSCSTGTLTRAQERASRLPFSTSFSSMSSGAGSKAQPSMVPMS